MDEQTRIVKFVAKPDPRRYEWKTMGNDEVLYDKFDRICFPKHIVKDMAESMSGMPIYYQPATIRDAPEYVRLRQPLIRSMLRGEQATPSMADPSDEFLCSLEINELDFVILSLDVVGSTALSTALTPSEYARVIQVLLFEIAEVIPHFNGHVLKYVGDEVVAYFAAPSFVTKNDLALNCALTLRRLVNDGLNPILVENGYAPVNVRIGIDSGPAIVTTIGSPSTKQHKDLIGDVINLACKIQKRAPLGGIAVGDVTLRNLHTEWRMMCDELAMGEDWEYQDRETGERYRVHYLRFVGE